MFFNDIFGVQGKEFDSAVKEVCKGLDLSGAIFLVLNAKGEVLDISESGAEFLGYRRFEVIGKDWVKEFVPVESHEEIKNVFADILSSGSDYLLNDNLVKLHDGSVRMVSWRNAIVKDADKEIKVLSIGVATNRSFSYNLEHRLDEEMLNQAGDAISLLDDNGIIMYVNKRALKDSGWSKDDLIGANAVNLLLPPNKVAWGVGIIKEVLLKGFGSYSMEFRRKDGSFYPVELTGKLLKTPERSYVIIVARDISERVAIEKMNREQGTKLKAYVENTKDIMYFADNNGNMVYISPQVRRYGFKENDVIGKSMLTFIHPDDHELVTSDFVDFMRSSDESKTCDTVFRVLTPDGQVFWFEESGKLSRGADGKPDGIIGTMRDITDRRKAEQALLENGRRYKAFFDNSKEIMYMFDNDDKLTYVSDQIRRYGIDPKDFIGKDFRELIHPDDIETVNKDYERQLLKSQTASNHYRIRNKKGESFWVQDVCQVMNDEEGNKIGMVGLAWDITEQKMSAEKINALMNNSVDLILVVDEGGLITFTSASCIGILGYAPEEMMGRIFRNFLHQDDVTGTLEKIIGRDKKTVRLRVRNKNGGFLKGEAVGQDYLSHPLIRGTVINIRDIGERQEMEEKIGRRLWFEGELAAAARDLLAVSSRNISQTMDETVARIAQRLGAESFGIWRLGPTHQIIVNDKWPGVISEGLLKKEVSLPWLYDKVQKSELVWGSPLGRLPSGAREDLSKVGLKPTSNFALLPIIVDGRAIGGVAIGTMDPHETWREEDMNAVRLLASIVGGAIQRQEEYFLSEKRATWNHVVADISAGLFRVSGTDEFDLALSNRLEKMARSIGAGCAIVVMGSRLSGLKKKAHWCHEHGTKSTGDEIILRWDDIAGLMPKTSKLAPFVFVRDYVGQEPDKNVILPLGVGEKFVSLTIFPIATDDQEIGFLVLASPKPQVSWAHDELEEIKVGASAITGAIVRHAASISMKKRLQIEQAVSEVASVLAGSIVEQGGDAMNSTFGILSSVLGLDAAAVYINESSGYSSRLYSLWTSGRIDPPNEVIEVIARSWLHRLLQSGETVSVTGLDDSNKDRMSCLSQMGVVAGGDAVVMPMMRGTESFGFIVLSGRDLFDNREKPDLLPYRTLSQAITSTVIRSRSEQRMREIDRLRIKFIHVVSHQLRTPLNSIRWSLESLLSGELGDLRREQHDFIQVIYDTELKIIRRIRDMIVAVDIEEGHVVINQERTSIEALVSSVVSTVKEMADLRRIKITYVPPVRPLSQILADPERIRFVISSLLDNAVIYSNEGGEVKISVTERDGFVRFEVEDHGIGIPAVEQSSMFNRFTRASNASVKYQDASGLGLSISKYYVEQHRGRISFESVEGEGSRFWFDLPVAGQ